MDKTEYPSELLSETYVTCVRGVRAAVAAVVGKDVDDVITQYNILNNKVLEALLSVRGNRSGKTPVTWDSARLMMAAELRILLEALEGEEV